MPESADETIADARPNVEQLLEARDLASIVCEGIPAKFVSIVFDCHVNGVTPDEIAKASNEKVDTVRRRLLKAVQALRGNHKRWELYQRAKGILALPFALWALLRSSRASAATTERSEAKKRDRSVSGGRVGAEPIKTVVACAAGLAAFLITPLPADSYRSDRPMIHADARVADNNATLNAHAGRPMIPIRGADEPKEHQIAPPKDNKATPARCVDNSPALALLRLSWRTLQQGSHSTARALLSRYSKDFPADPCRAERERIERLLP
jgi:hypothetical protein